MTTTIKGITIKEITPAFESMCLGFKSEYQFFFKFRKEQLCWLFFGHSTKGNLLSDLKGFVMSQNQIGAELELSG